MKNLALPSVSGGVKAHKSVEVVEGRLGPRARGRQPGHFLGVVVAVRRGPKSEHGPIWQALAARSRGFMNFCRLKPL